MPCILVVDDEADIRDSLKAVLESSIVGVRVRTAGSGRDALLALEEERGAVRLIIADFRMPGMDGAQFLGLARKAAPLVPSLMMTAHDLTAADLPGIRLMRKPVSARELIVAVADAITPWAELPKA